MDLNAFMDNEVGRIGRLSLVEGRPHHAIEIADCLRMFDLRECMIHGVSAIQALTEPFSVHNSVTYSIKFDDVVIAMCGTVPTENNSARVWMLGTGGINENYRIFLRGCKKAIEILQADYSMIENYVPVDHVDTIMWLSWCGFVFDEELYNLNGHSMMRFVRCRPEKNNVYYLERPVMH